MAAAKSPEVIADKSKMRSWSRSLRSQGKTLALVPTMGFLHQGHLSLVHQAKAHADITVVSIYVNPGQFAPSEDLASYPSDLDGDLRKLAEIGVDAVFCPKNLYDYGAGSVGRELKEKEEGGKMESCIESEGGGGGLGHETWIRVEKLEKGLCGKSRPVFFRGVTTVVAKLFNIVDPDFALFGKKDYQQWRIVCRMVRDLDFAIQIIGAEITREDDGLAMSSRNVHLSPEEREKALSINKSLSEAKYAAQNGEHSCQKLKLLITQSISKASGSVDYVEIVEQETLTPVEEVTRPVVICVAALFGRVRLIDNVEINT